MSGQTLGRTQSERLPSRKLRPICCGSLRVMAPTKICWPQGVLVGVEVMVRVAVTVGVGVEVQVGHGVEVLVGVKGEQPSRTHLMSKPCVREFGARQAYSVKRALSFCTRRCRLRFPNPRSTRNRRRTVSDCPVAPGVTSRCRRERADAFFR